MIGLTPVFITKGAGPLHRQLYRYIRSEIETGAIRPHAKLPSKRSLSAHLKISQNTVHAAYQQLVAEGYIVARPRSGYYAGEIGMSGGSGAQAVERRPAAPPEETGKKQAAPDISFDHAAVDIAAFPFGAWRRLYREVLSADRTDLATLGDSRGDPGLRRELSRYLYQARGVVCSPEQIVVGAGTQTLLMLLVQLLGLWSSYAMENPGYSRVRHLFEAMGVEPAFVPLDRYGLAVDALRKSDADIVYVTPSHQFPMGMVMPIARRTELLRWAEEKDGRYVIEDDYDSEFRYAGMPIPALQGLGGGKVVYVGTLSKALMPSLRLGYMVLPHALLERYKERLTFYPQSVSRVDQLVMERFIRDGHWAKHLQKMRITYGRKKEALVAALKTTFAEDVRFVGEEAGLHVAAAFAGKLREAERIELARRAGVVVHPASVHYAPGTDVSASMGADAEIAVTGASTRMGGSADAGGSTGADASRDTAVSMSTGTSADTVVSMSTGTSTDTAVSMSTGTSTETVVSMSTAPNISASVLLLGFANLSEGQIAAGVSRLKEAWGGCGR
ncbi:PLP-dependent aminotransferase family protein [Paenibacillus sp. IB182363]|uniref:PLP-dependent aminotransferase family protein n=2 Tax=Paenibacillus oceani TaxID=2772510 RepID=A0A927CHM7_9BACL|nr:PLP-dependent aminotransferase family protein [Paenibacillus oceani]